MHHLQGVTLVFLILDLLGECSQADTYDVLALLPLVSPSNHQYDEAVLMALARRGHRVTVYSEFPPETLHPLYRHVLLEEDHFYYYGQPKYDYFDIRWEFWKISDYDNLTKLNEWRFGHSVRYVKNSVQFTALQENLKSGKEHYDVVVTERLSGQEHLLLFSQWANAPLVVLEPFGRNISNDLNLIYEPSEYLIALMNDFGNLSPINPFQDFEDKYSHYLRAGKEFLQSPPNPALDIFLTYPLLTYTNDMMTKNVTYPTVRVSGIHINPSSPPLHEIEQKFLDAAERGDQVVVVDLESPALELRRAKLPGVTFFTPSLPGLRTYSGPNEQTVLRIQQKILEHRNCKLLITDGGLLRVQEAIYYGLMVLVVPRTYTQNYTAAYIKEAGIGESMKPEDFNNTSKLLVKVKELLSNDWYKGRADNVSREFRSMASNLEWTVHHSLVKAMTDYRQKITPSYDQHQTKSTGDMTSVSRPMIDASSQQNRTKPGEDAVFDSRSTTDAAPHQTRSKPEVDVVSDSRPTTEAISHQLHNVDSASDFRPTTDTAPNQTRSKPEVDAVSDSRPTTEATSHQLHNVDSVSDSRPTTDAAPNQTRSKPEIDGVSDSRPTTYAAPNQTRTKREVDTVSDTGPTTDAVSKQPYTRPLLDYLIENCLAVLNIFCVTTLYCCCSGVIFLLLFIITVYGIKDLIYCIRRPRGNYMINARH